MSDATTTIDNTETPPELLFGKSGAGESTQGDQISFNPSSNLTDQQYQILMPFKADLAKARIVIVDDESINIKVVQKFLELGGYSDFITTTDSTRATDMIKEHRPDIILLDIMMPNVSGLDILRDIRKDQSMAHVPILILTASSDNKTRSNALELGASDYLAKPVDNSELLTRVRNSLNLKLQHDYLANQAEHLEQQVQKRTAELAAARLELIHCLARAAEFRDNETGKHVIRVGRYAGLIAREMALPEQFVTLLENAAPLHDIGKVGIPDEILLKPGKLTPEEFAFMQKHSEYGNYTCAPMHDSEWQSLQTHTQVGEIISKVGQSPIMHMAGSIALTHHEKWDGAGYPNGLKGNEIPIEGRITAVADVFDALSSERPYKKALPLEECFQIMEEERNRHFCPEVLDAFFRCKAEILNVRMQCLDTE